MEELTELNILYEDNHIIVVEKKPNIPVWGLFKRQRFTNYYKGVYKSKI